MDYKKYRAFPAVELPGRQWPQKTIVTAPAWCSVDLRDGNQALPVPMTFEQKIEFFKMLVDIGFKEIEVAFPAAADTEFNFVRALIEGNLIPEDVKIQVLTQARPHIIEKTFESVRGAKNVIMHMYNSTSTLQREVVFRTDQNGVKKIAQDGIKLCLELAQKQGLENFQFEYSPESFTGTELDFSVEICQSVLDILLPVVKNDVILNLPSTVEMATPNVYADQIEYFSKNIGSRDRVIISLHAHNDRGCGVAATELGILAGGNRVEGTLFGNGERTGNADIVTLALNLYTQGVDCGLNFGKIDEIARKYAEWTNMTIHERAPYVGELVYTAFSGSHQDAIKKGMDFEKKGNLWQVPYLPIDPSDLGRTYDPIIRINSQSGKGGVAFVLERTFGLQIPKDMQPIVGAKITSVSDKRGKELTPDEIFDIFNQEFVDIDSPIAFNSFNEKPAGLKTTMEFIVSYDGRKFSRILEGEGPIGAFVKGMAEIVKFEPDVRNYAQHALGEGKNARAITYVLISVGKDSFFGAGIDVSVSKSSLKAVVSAINNAIRALK